MRKKFQIVFFTLCLSFSFAGCERPENRMPVPQPSVVVMKMVKPEYKDYILLNHHAGDSVLLALRGSVCNEPIGKSGYSPYWELTEDWLLVDWKWRNFPYNAGLVLLTNHTWKDYEWDPSLYPPFPKWSINEPHIAQPVEQIVYIPIKQLESYSNATYDSVYNLAYKVSEYGKVYVNGEDSAICVCVFSDRLDSIWGVFQKDLSSAISKGDLNRLALSN